MSHRASTDNVGDSSTPTYLYSTFQFKREKDKETKEQRKTCSNESTDHPWDIGKVYLFKQRERERERERKL